LSLPNVIAAYDDCEELFARASSSAKGARALIVDHGQAKLFQLRMNKYRHMLRQEAKRMYDITDPAWGKSEYDALKVSLRESAEGDGHWWVYVTPHALNIIEIETLDEEEIDGAA